MNEGKIRILIGSTEKCGAGTNVQKRLAALHHLDAPYRPRDLQQRDGRGIRQGNTNEEVKIFTYVTKRTLDSYCYQILENKQRFISQIEKSFNKVINDALYFGLDELMRHLFEPEETVETEQERVLERKLIRRADGLNETYFMETAKLLQELIVNVTINKSMLSALFNAKARELNRKSVSGEKFTDGRYRKVCS